MQKIPSISDKCCFDVEIVVDGELVDTREGYTWKYVTICRKCKRAWQYFTGERAEDEEELFGKDAKEYV